MPGAHARANTATAGRWPGDSTNVSHRAGRTPHGASVAGLFLQAVDCLNRIALTSRRLDVVERCAGPALAALGRHADHVALADKALTFLDTLTKLGLDMTPFLSADHVMAICRAMRAHPANAHVQARRCRRRRRRKRRRRVIVVDIVVVVVAVAVVVIDIVVVVVVVAVVVGSFRLRVTHGWTAAPLDGDDDDAPLSNDDDAHGVASRRCPRRARDDVVTRGVAARASLRLWSSSACAAARRLRRVFVQASGMQGRVM